MSSQSPTQPLPPDNFPEPPQQMPPELDDDGTFASSEQNQSPEDQVSVISALQQQVNGQPDTEVKQTTPIHLSIKKSPTA